MNKIVIAFIVAMIVLGGFLYWNSEAWDEGTPEATITARIIDNSGDIQWSATINIDDVKSHTAAMIPATTYTANVPALNPNAHYTIGFIVTGIFDTDGDATITQTGETGAGKVTYSDESSPQTTITDTMEIVPNVPTAFDFGNINWKYRHEGIMDMVPILGLDVNNSAFDFSIVATGYNSEGAWATGSLQFDVIINVGATGTINITIDNIETEVTQQ